MTSFGFRYFGDPEWVPLTRDARGAGGGPVATRRPSRPSPPPSPRPSPDSSARSGAGAGAGAPGGKGDMLSFGFRFFGDPEWVPLTRDARGAGGDPVATRRPSSRTSPRPSTPPSPRPSPYTSAGSGAGAGAGAGGEEGEMTSFGFRRFGEPGWVRPTRHVRGAGGGPVATRRRASPSTSPRPRDDSTTEADLVAALGRLNLASRDTSPHTLIGPAVLVEGPWSGEPPTKDQLAALQRDKPYKPEHALNLTWGEGGAARSGPSRVAKKPRAKRTQAKPPAAAKGRGKAALGGHEASKHGGMEPGTWLHLVMRVKAERGLHTLAEAMHAAKPLWKKQKAKATAGRV